MTNRDPTDFLKVEYQQLVDEARDWKHKTLESGSNPECIIDGKKVIIKTKANDQGDLYGSVGKQQIKKALKIKRKINLSATSSIKSVGKYDMEVRIGKSKAKIVLEVKSE